MGELEVEPGGDELALAAEWTQEVDESPAEGGYPDTPLVDGDSLGAEPEAPAWAGPSREEWEQSQDALGYFTSLVSEAEEAAAAQAEEAELEAAAESFLGDPWDEGYADRLAQVERVQLADVLREYVDERLTESITPVTEFHEEQRYAEAEVEADRILDESFAPFGVTLNDELRGQLRELAEGAYPEYVELLVSQGVPAEEAGYQAAAAVLEGLGPYFAGEAERQSGDELDVLRRHTAEQPVPLAPTLRGIVRSTLGQGPFGGSWVRPKERI